MITTFSDHLLTIAEHAGATHIRVVDPAQLRVEEHVRLACAANACGKYGRCWTCPPAVGELATLGARMQRFATGVLVQNIYELEDSWDFEGMQAGAKAHNDMIRGIARQLQETYGDGKVLPLGCGGCGYCERCSHPEASCRFPEHALASIEGYGVDVKRLVEGCGLKYINGVNTVSYVGVVLYQEV